MCVSVRVVMEGDAIHLHSSYDVAKMIAWLLGEDRLVIGGGWGFKFLHRVCRASG
jgi:hypothetical protein